MASPAKFAKNIHNVALRIEGNVEKGVRKTVLAIDNALVNTTPVDTGRARSNWLPNLDGPADGTVGPSSSPSAKTAGLVRQFDVNVNSAIHLTNNLPYIASLDRGSSKQRAAGFVRRAILAGVGVVKSVKLLKR